MKMRRLRTCLLVTALIASCQKAPPAPGTDNPAAPGLTFGKLPAAIVVDGRFEVWARLNDDFGNMTDDSQTMVTIRADGHGTLRGTLTRRAIGGQVDFDDLFYDRWEPITLTISAEGYPNVNTTTPIPVRPVMRFVSMPPAHVPAGTPIGPLTIELVDGRGQAVKADQMLALEGSADVVVDGGPTRNFSAGPVTYPQITLQTAGSRTLVWHSNGLADLIAGITVHDGQETESIWLPAGRIGVPYRAQLPSDGTQYRVLNDGLPQGLTLEATGELHGTPTEAQHAHVEIFALRGTGSVLWKADLPVFADSEAAPGTLDAQDVDGPFPVSSFDETVDVSSRHATVNLRIYHPMGGATMATPMPLKVIVFHHGAAVFDPAHLTLFDRYDALVKRWASYGFVVGSIDSPDTVWDADGRLVNASLSNLQAMSENQRAAIAHLRARNGNATFPLAGMLDMDRVIVAGHSRGGGASILTAVTEPSVVGGILLEPLDPMTTVGGADIWNTMLPQKPFLLVVAGDDGDLPYPMVDFVYDRRTGPMVAPTIVGTLHFFTCDDRCRPEPDRNASITRQQTWSIINAYAVPFLKYIANDDMSVAPLLFGHEGATTHLSPAGVFLRSDRGAASEVVDDFQDEEVGRNSLGLESSDQLMSWSADEPSLLSALRMLPDGYDNIRVLYERPETLVLSNAHRLEWSQNGATYSTALGTLDARRRSAFVFRARSEGMPIPAAQLSVRFTDHQGNTITLPGSGLVGELGIGDHFTDVIAPMLPLREAGLDLLELENVAIVLQGTGAMVIDDLRFE